jgi:hypothetical protein
VEERRFQRRLKLHLNIVIPSRAEGPARNLLLTFAGAREKLATIQAWEGVGFSRAAWPQQDVGFSP